ncbi:TetR family transcriptional regulator [Streptomyces lunaelactis]|uniref:TetR family transcriptional regulator n=1 Tax=Streptomyces lunaelactis TaxID=1535768 RepID=A0A2R4TCZ9_9ACTN|nr:TetR/AcrR family transcriptional regulator [Streptomyces lunaelactis]AVZ76987.1 TetR family transcriptional regulator [Streptomyces lunaelactis]NUK86054.1 TetR/AcrR family transcriptional regulator [Streptomyces lunaelactis]
MHARLSPEDSPRERILAATAKLLADGGREAVSTRAVSAAADVQAPTIYRLFGDKQGLLDAAAAEGFTAYLNTKTAREPTDDPVEDLRTGWDMHVGFGLANPALYLVMSEPRPATEAPPAAVAGAEVLATLIHRIAEAGRLRVSEDRAAHLVQAAGRGTTLMLISMPEGSRDPELSVMAREAVITAITTGTPELAPPGPVSAAVALRAVLPQTSALTDREQALLREWLDRIAGPAH